MVHTTRPSAAIAIHVIKIKLRRQQDYKHPMYEWMRGCQSIHPWSVQAIHLLLASCTFFSSLLRFHSQFIHLWATVCDSVSAIDRNYTHSLTHSLPQHPSLSFSLSLSLSPAWTMATWMTTKWRIKRRSEWSKEEKNWPTTVCTASPVSWIHATSSFLDSSLVLFHEKKKRKAALTLLLDWTQGGLREKREKWNDWVSQCLFSSLFFTSTFPVPYYPSELLFPPPACFFLSFYSSLFLLLPEFLSVQGEVKDVSEVNSSGICFCQIPLPILYFNWRKREKWTSTHSRHFLWGEIFCILFFFFLCHLYWSARRKLKLTVWVKLNSYTLVYTHTFTCTWEIVCEWTAFDVYKNHSLNFTLKSHGNLKIFSLHLRELHWHLHRKKAS